MDKVFIIAEAGVNHNGSLDCAKRLIDVAAESGADAVKFQTFISEQCISKWADKANYQKMTTSVSESQLDMVKKLELPFEAFVELKEYCKMKDILFMSTPFDLESADFLNQIELDIFKIPSGEITNYPLIKKIGGFRKKVILSTGMSMLDEVRDAIQVLIDNGSKDITLLHCNTEYPTPYEDVNLRAMLTLKNELGVDVGYSDHTEGIEIPIAAAALGAKVIEKHFTLDKNMEGPDHKASLEPDELCAMVKAVRNIELALGNGEKKPSESEQKNMDIVRKSIVAKCDIKAGETFTENNLATKRPGSGISPMQWNEVMNRKAKRDFKMDELIEI